MAKKTSVSASKWTVIPHECDLEKSFVFGSDFLERITKMASNKFWLDVLKSLKYLWLSNTISNREVILDTPLWYNQEFQFPHRREWLEIGINVVSDLLSCTRVMLSQEELEAIYNIKVYFIDYFNISKKITDYLYWRKRASYAEPYPKNSSVNIILNIDKKGCSNLYKKLKD